MHAALPCARTSHVACLRVCWARTYRIRLSNLSNLVAGPDFLTEKGNFAKLLRTFVYLGLINNLHVVLLLHT